MIYCICPFSKPNFRDLTLHNFNQQEYFPKKLIVVENGPGTGCFSSSDNIIVLRSGNHQSLAKNIGLQYLRGIGAEYWATMDCDDYYGPRYLSELSANKYKAPIIGKTKYYIRMEDGSLYLFNGGSGSGYVMSVWGATIGSWVNKSPDFDVVPVGEEEMWMRKFRLHNGIYNTGPDHFIHLRWDSGHVTHGMDKNQFFHLEKNRQRVDPKSIPGLSNDVYQAF